MPGHPTGAGGESRQGRHKYERFPQFRYATHWLSVGPIRHDSTAADNILVAVSGKVAQPTVVPAIGWHGQAPRGHVRGGPTHSRASGLGMPHAGIRFSIIPGDRNVAPRWHAWEVIVMRNHMGVVGTCLAGMLISGCCECEDSCCDCPGNEFIGCASTLLPSCETQADCPVGLVCIEESGRCEALCDNQVDCPTGLVCSENGVCEVPPDPACESNADCDDGDACNGNETCGAEFACAAGTPVQCGANETCDSLTGACQPTAS